LEDIRQSEAYAESTSKHAKEIISELQRIGQEFYFTANMEFIEFEREINIGKQKVIRLDIVNYSFETLVIKDDTFEFRAGFNTSNGTIESGVKVDYIGLQRIVIHENDIIFANFSTIEKRSSRKNRKNLFLNRNNFENE
jgi:hypothetical protein